MRYLLPVILFVAGCVNTEVSAAEQNLLDNQLENRYDEETWTEPQEQPYLSVELEETHPEFFVNFDEVCVCEWRAWEDNQGLLCVGVVCSNACSTEVSECRETQQACVPRM